ncbi:MAG: MFS transporter, partial [Bacteriovoracaceae bacterium]|nr:MFS transporter [Bacteriovoracaceae bacterium]
MNRQIYLAYLNTFTFSCIQMVLYTTIPYIAEQTGVVTSTIILAISVGSFLFAGMGPFWAAKSDRLGRKRVLSFGMFGMMLSFALISSLFIFNEQIPLAIKVVMVFASRIIYGLLASAIVPVSQAWQLDLIGSDNHLKVLTRNSMCLNIGRVVGPILILVKQVDFELVIYTATVWVFLLSTFCLFTSATQPKLETVEVKFKELVQRWKFSIKESYMPILLAMVFTSFIGVLHSFLGHHLKTVLDLSGKDATMMFAKIILALSIMAVVFQQLSISMFKSKWIPRVIIGSISIVIGTY